MFCLISFFRSISCYTGWLYDITNSFTVSFDLLAVVALLPLVTIGVEKGWLALTKHRVPDTDLNGNVP